MFIGLKITNSHLSLKEKFFFLCIPIYKTKTMFLNNGYKTNFYLFSLIKLFVTVSKNNKKSFYFLRIPILRVKQHDSNKIIRLFGLTIYSNNNYKQNIFSSNNDYSVIEKKYMEMDLLIKTVASSLREIKRLENNK